MLNIFKKHLSASFVPTLLVNNINDYDECWENRGLNVTSLNSDTQLSKLIDRHDLVLEIVFGAGTAMHD